MSDYKYVILRDGRGREFPVIFAGELAHVDVARGICYSAAMSEWGERTTLEPVAAGFAYLDEIRVGDRGSESLDLSPRPQDRDVMELHPHTHGIVENIPMIKRAFARALGRRRS